jgi:hypothetical protein
VPAGTHTVSFSGLAANCTAVGGQTSWQVSVSGGGQEVAAVFAANCT